MAWLGPAAALGFGWWEEVVWKPVGGGRVVDARGVSEACSARWMVLGEALAKAGLGCVLGGGGGGGGVSGGMVRAAFVERGGVLGREMVEDRVVTSTSSSSLERRLRLVLSGCRALMVCRGSATDSVAVGGCGEGWKGQRRLL